MLQKQLTQNEQIKAEQAAYDAFQKRQELYSPPPQPNTGDLIRENPRVMSMLVKAVGYLPLLLVIVGVAAAVVSMDKTASAFEASVAHPNGLGGAWLYIVALSGVVMADLALVLAEFAMVRDMLRKGLHRNVFNIKDFNRAIRVRLGLETPLDYGQMPDQTLVIYSRFLFLLILAGNIFAVTRTGNIKGIGDLTFSNCLLLLTGIAGALSLKFLGRQLSHIVYELAQERAEIQRQAMFEEWQDSLVSLWQTEGPQMINAALHQAFLKKNKLPLEAGSPYLLSAGEDGLELFPFQSSQNQSLVQSKNGNRD